MIKELKKEIQDVMNRANAGHMNSVDAAIVVMEIQSSIIALLESHNSSLIHTDAAQGRAVTVVKEAA